MRKSVGLSVTTKDILEYLELITIELTDAHHLTDTDSTVNANCAVTVSYTHLTLPTKRIV